MKTSPNIELVLTLLLHPDSLHLLIKNALWVYQFENAKKKNHVLLPLIGLRKAMGIPFSCPLECMHPSG